MEQIKTYLLQEMTKALEKQNELELQLMIAKKEYNAISKAYKAYVESEVKDNA